LLPHPDRFKNPSVVAAALAISAVIYASRPVILLCLIKNAQFRLFANQLTALFKNDIGQALILSKAFLHPNGFVQ
jgi:hypothetical protein